MAAQHEEIQGLLADNQRLAATHVALKQEVAAATHELQRLSHVVGIEQAEGEARINEVYEKSMKMEADFRATEAMRAELTQVLGDIQKINAARQELTGQVHMLTQDTNKATAEVQQVPAIKAEIEYMKQELQQARQAIEYEKKGYAENYEQGQEMEKNLISMAREVEKLRAEVANAAKRARAAAAVGSQGAGAAATAAGYGVNYAIPDSNYGGNPYPVAYQSNPVPTADGGPQYPTGASNVPVNGSWGGAYDMQHSQHAMRR